MSVSKQVIVGSMWSSGARILTAFFRIGLLLILSRLLEPEDFGLFQVVSMVFLYMVTLSNLGLGSAIVQKKDLLPEHIHTVFWAYAFLGFTGSLLLFFLAPLIAEFFKQENLTVAVRVIAFLPLTHTLSAVSRSLLLKELKIKQLSIIETLSYLLGYIPVTLILAFAGFGYWSLIAGFVIQSLFTALMSFRAFPFRPAFVFSFQKFKELFRFGFFDTLNIFAAMTANQADTFFIGRLMGPVSLGLYNRAYNLMAANVNLFSDFIDRIFFAGFSQKQDSDESLLRAFYKADFLIMAFMLPLGFYCFANAKDLIIVLLGEKWLPAAIAFQILSLGLVFRLNYKISYSIIRAKGNMESTLWIWIANIGLTVILMFSLKNHGIEGIALALLISMIYRYFHLLFSLKREIKSFFIWKVLKNNSQLYALGGLFLFINFWGRNFLLTEKPILVLASSLLIMLLVFSPLFFNPVVKEFFESISFKFKPLPEEKL